MAKQIILTQNNFGIPIELQFIDDKNKPIDISNKTVEVAISYDGTIIDVLQAVISLHKNGIAYIVIDKKHTKDVGLYTTYWSVKDSNGYVTAQSDLYYYVKEEYNGSVMNDIEQEDSFILDKLKEELSNIKLFNENASNEINTLKIQDLEFKNDVQNIKNSLIENNNDIKLLKSKTEENRTTLSSLSSSVTNLSNSVTQNYQTKTSDKLKTTSKDVVGAINEIKDFVSVDNTLNENGYYNLPNGLIMQWGTAVLSNSAYDAEIRITMPKSVQKILSPMVTLSDMTGRVTYTTYNLDTTGFLIKMRSVAPVVGTGVGIGAIRIYWFALCK